ncbi:uncharacterized protein [Antedon mediterranea]|uniref:uncharacterized protein n=1 Tax=Antedon mediterranea TaxID=105859 RepID=UPI003AF76BB7
MDDMNCSRSWQAYGLAAVSGVLIIETFIISVYFFVRHNRRSTTLKKKVKFDKVESSSRYTNSSQQNGHGITSVSVISETTEQTTKSENRRLESLHEHIKQNGLAKGTGDVSLQKSSDPVQDLSAQELQLTSITMVGKKSSKNGKQRERHQRIDPHHRSKQRADIIRMNSAGSIDEERDASATKTKAIKKKNSDKKLKNKRNKLTNKSQKGIMKPSNQDVLDKNGSAKQDSVSSRKKSVRFALERQNESEAKTVSPPKTPEKSKISIISANRPKLDDQNIDDILRGYSEEDVPSEKVSGKRQFIMISDEEDEPAIVEIETTEKSDNKGSSNQTAAVHQNTDDDDGKEDDDSSDGQTIQDSNLPQSNSPKEDKNNNGQKITQNETEVQFHGTNKQTTLTDKTSTHHDIQIKTAETTPLKMDIITTPQSVVLVKKNDEEAATTSQNASNTTNQISTSDNGNISSAKEADNIRNTNVKIIPLENEEDGVVQSKRSIANGHVNSMIKMFQKLDGGKELSEEFNC